MPKHTFEILDTTEAPAKSMSREQTGSLTGISIQPPIQLGEAFADVVLGRNPTGVDLKHVLTTGNETLFLVECNTKNPLLIDEAAYKIGERICALADNPDGVAKMITESPFYRDLPIG